MEKTHIFDFWCFFLLFPPAAASMSMDAGMIVLYPVLGNILG
jgi:hypothetical protein